MKEKKTYRFFFQSYRVGIHIMKALGVINDAMYMKSSQWREIKSIFEVFSRSNL